MSNISSILKKIPTVDSCWFLDLKTAGLAIGLVDIIFSFTELLVALTFRPWGTVPIAVILLLAHISLVYGIHQKKRDFMVPGLVLPAIFILLCSIFILLLPLIGLIGFASDIDIDGLLFAGILLVSCVALVKYTAIEAYLWVVKYSLYKSMEENHMKTSTTMHTIFL